MSNIKLQIRRDTAANWTTINPILLPGEVGFELNTGKLKIGKVAGQRWNDIPYILSDVFASGTPTASKFLRGDSSWTTIAISDISGLQTALNDKSDSDHTHALSSFGVTGTPSSSTFLRGDSSWTAITISSISGLQTALDLKATALEVADKANAVHTHSINDLTATGVKNNTTYLRGDNVWAVPSGSGGGGGTISGVLSQSVTNWTNGQEIVLSHDVERNGVRLFAAYQQKSSAITDVTWNFNNTSDSKWTNGRIEFTRLTTPIGQNSTTAISKDDSAIPSFAWSSITSMTAIATEGVIKDSLLMDCSDFISEDISGFLDSASGAYATNLRYASDNRAYLSTAQAKFGTSSIRFKGSAQNSGIGLSNPNFAVGTGDFTIEFFAFLLSHKNYNNLFDFRSRGGATSTGGSSGWVDVSQNLYYYPDNTPIVPSGGISLNAWHHFRFERYNGQYAIYFNGTRIHTAANTRNFVYTMLSLGGTSDYGEGIGTFSLDGYIDEFRFSNVARTQGAASFSVPTEPFTSDANTVSLLHFNGPNNSTGPYALLSDLGNVCTNHYTESILPTWLPNVDTNGAYYSNGDRASGILTFSDPIRTGNFTFEAWVYLDRNVKDVRDMYFLEFRFSGINWVWLLTGPNNGNEGRFSFWIGGNYPIGTPVAINSWFHFAIVRESEVAYVYVNGVQQGSVSCPGNINLTSVGFMGRHDDTNSFVSGYMKQIRFSKVARYTGNFTPPTRTSEITTDSNDILYLNGNYNGKRNAISVGDGKIGVLASHYVSLPKDSTAMTGRAAYFNSAGQISVDSSSDFNLSSGDFTIETSFFVENWRSVGVELIGKGSSGSSNGEFSIHCYSGALRIATGGSSFGDVAYPTINDGTWHHLAIVMVGTTLKYFFDGVGIYSATTGMRPSFGNSPLCIGGRGDGSHPWNGKIGFARIRKGQAIYTNNFIPPTAFPTLLQTTNQLVRIALSFDGRTSWKAFNGTSWITANIENIKNTGMSPATANAITQGQWAQIFSGGVTAIDLAAYLETDNSNLTPNISDISFNAVSNYWETIPMHQLTVKLMSGDTRFVQNTGGTISFGKIVVAISQ